MRGARLQVDKCVSASPWVQRIADNLELTMHLYFLMYMKNTMVNSRGAPPRLQKKNNGGAHMFVGLYHITDTGHSLGNIRACCVRLLKSVYKSDS